MKVLHILNELRYSGAEVMLHDAQDFFKRNGVDITVLSTGVDPGPYADTLRRCGYVVDHIPFRKTPAYFRQLFRYFRKQQPDAIHIQPERAYFYHALVARIACPRARLVRSYLDVFFQYGGLKRRIRSLQRWCARRWFGVAGIAISHSVQAVEQACFGNPTRVIYDWIDEETYRVPTESERQQARASLGLAPDAFVLCTVGTCNEKKRHADILEAMARVKERTPGLCLLHRGTGPDTDAEIDLCRRLGIEDRVRFVGYVESLAGLYWAADAFIFSSRWEGLGDVIIEAIACGLPVILYDGWGMRDFKPVETPSYGWWLNADRETFNAAIVDLFQRRTALVPAYRTHARAFYDWRFGREKSLQALLSIYTEAANARAGTRP